MNWVSRIFISLVLFHCAINLMAQNEYLKELEKRYKDLYGKERLIALNSLSDYYLTENPKKALRYSRQAITLGNNIIIDQNNLNSDDSLLMEQTYYHAFKAMYANENYFECREIIEDLFKYSAGLDNPRYLEVADNYLRGIEDKIASGEINDNFFNKNFSDLNIGQKVNSAALDLQITAELKEANFAQKKGDFNSAIESYQKLINLYRNKGDQGKITEMQYKIATLYDSLNDHQSAQEILAEALNEKASKRDGIDSVESFKITETDIEQIDKSLSDKKRNLDSLQLKKENLKKLSEASAKNNDFSKSIAYYKEYLELSQKMKEDSLNILEETKIREAEIRLLKQQKNIADLKIKASATEKDKQIRLRNSIITIAVIILLSTIVILFFYFAKRKEHKKLSIAYSDLDQTRIKLENAEGKITALLKQQVSSDIAGELITNQGSNKGKRHFVCIMFLDIEGFTPKAEKMSPEQLIGYQNKIFSFMIDIIDQYNGNINQLLGDGFMATFGAPISHGNDCQNAFDASLEILEKLKSQEHNTTNVRIGLHAGYVIAGNVGNEKRKQFSVTGNPVIISSRLEQLNKEYNSRLIISEEAYKQLDNKRNSEAQNKVVKIKGRKEPISVLIIS